MGSGADYDVFLNYRVTDSLGLVDPLYHRMVEAGIRVFRDDDELSMGVAFGPSMLRAIQNCKIYIPIFSKNYASNPWCLRELAYMVDLWSESDEKKVILPIFYDVKPSDVKLQTELYNENLLNLAEKFGSDETGRWRVALIEVARLLGLEWDVNPKSLGRQVDSVVEEVLKMLKVKTLQLVQLVGIDDRVEALIKLLDGGDSVCFLGIFGMGGIGKTVLAKAVFNQLASHFEGSSFLENIGELSAHDGLLTCQKQLLFDIIRHKPPSVHSVHDGIRFIQRCLSHYKVLLVLDGIDHMEQLRCFAGDRDWFGFGSRIIITTRNRDILNPAYSIIPYEMHELDADGAFNLFNMHAFGRGFPPEDWYTLSREVVSILEGLPLALEVVGSLLHGKDKAVWQEALMKLKKGPVPEVQNKFRFILDALKDFEREIFLDIACFFINKDVTEAICMWDDCCFYPRLGLSVLVDMSLIKITDNNTIRMHAQLRAVGREIVHQENSDPGRRSRVWHHKEALDLIKNKRKNLKKVQALSLAGDTSRSIITNEGFAGLRNLRFLELEGAFLDGNFKDLLQQLRYLSWHFCPEEFKATSLELRNLVVLNLSEGHIRDEWGGWRHIKAMMLKVLDLTSCQGITKMPDLSGFLSLERLILCNCLKLGKMDSSIVELKRLTYLNLKGCISLQDVPKEIENLKNLEYLCLERCSEITMLPSGMGDLKNLLELNISDTGIRELPQSFVELKRLTYLNLKGCISLQNVPEGIGKLENLEYLCLERCSEITELPSGMGHLEKLLELNISDTGIRVLPDSFGKLKQLEVISSKKDKLSLLSAEQPQRPRDELTEKLEGVNPNRKGGFAFLTALKLPDCSDSIHILLTAITELVNLLTLDLEDCNKLQQLPKLPKSLKHLKLPLFPRCGLNNRDLIKVADLLLCDGSGDLSPRASNAMLTSLKWLRKLDNQQDLESCLADILAPSIKLSCLSWLNKQLSLLYQGLQSLFWLSSSLSVLAFEDFCSINMRSYISSLKNSSNLLIYQYDHEEIQLYELEGLRKLTLKNCEPLQRVSNLSIWKNLKELGLFRCPKLVELQNLGGFESLEKLHVNLCQSIERLSGLSNLRKLNILIIEECGALKDVEGLDELDSLRYLKMWNCSMLKHLTDVSNTKIPDKCEVIIWKCGGLHDFGHLSHGLPSDQKKKKSHGLPYKHYREVVLGTTDWDAGSDLAKRAGKMSDMELKASVNLEESIFKGQAVDMETSGRNYAIASVQKLVGIDDRAKQMTDLLEMEVNDEVRIIGIYGTDGIGKTTLAKAVYDNISSFFDSCSFLAEVDETTQISHDIRFLQTKLIRDILALDREDPSSHEKIEIFVDIFRKMKVLIVVDGVENQSHLHAIVGDRLNWFGLGSRIIVTSQNKEILKEYDPEKTRTYMASELDDGQALKLFCKHAFRVGSQYDKLADRIVNVTEKVPLAVEVVGSFLRGKSIHVWKKMEESMKERIISSQKTTVGLEETLDICYKELDHQQKKIFLDIACSIFGVDARIASYLWPNCYFPSSGCIPMPLAKIGENNELQMHRLLRCLGKRIFEQEGSGDPSSRFCMQDMVIKAMNSEEGIENVEACDSRILRAKTFKSMPVISFLKLDDAKVSGDFTDAFKSLRWLCWQRCPLEFDAINFVLGELVILDLSWSKVTEDWRGWSEIKMEKLKVLNLTGCSALLITPDFSGYKKLEMLILERCSRLMKLDPSIGHLKRLVSLNLKFCSRLERLPVELSCTTALKELFIDGTSIQEIPISIGNLRQLEILSGFKCFPLTHLPSSISCLTALTVLSLDGAKISKLPSSLGELLNLRHLSLRDCRYMQQLPDSIGKMGSSLEELDISATSISKLPDSIKDLQNLRVLRMDSSFIRAFPEEIGNLTKLEELHSSWCRNLKGAIPRDIKRLHHLRSLTLRRSSISSLPSEISTVSSLHTLDLLQCNEIEVLPELPSSLICLRVSSKRMKTIPRLNDLKELEELYLSDEDPEKCQPPSKQLMPESKAKQLSMWFSRLWNLELFQSHRIFLISFPKLRKLELSLSRIIKLQFVYEPTDIPQLKALTLSGLSSAIEEIEGLEGLKALKRLEISNCKIHNLNGIGQLASLRSLILSDCDDLSLPDLSNLKSLKVLEIKRCKMIHQIKGLEMLSLEKLNINECMAKDSV